MSSRSYKTLTTPKHLKRKVYECESIGILRTNNDHVDDVLKIFSSKNKDFYVHFLDGDHWGEREAWKNNDAIDRYDFNTPYQLFQISPFKDCVFQWADEFVIVSPYDLTSKIDLFLVDCDFTMTRLVFKTNQADFTVVARLSQIIREKKLIQRGCTHFIHSLD